MLNLKDPAQRAEWVYGQKMEPCPTCGAYDMKPQMPIVIDLEDVNNGVDLARKWAKAVKDGALLEGPCYYICWKCGHKGPSVDQKGRSSDEARKDAELNREMKKLWNNQSKVSKH
jgi:hypothetical protein